MRGLFFAVIPGQPKGLNPESILTFKESKIKMGSKIKMD
jgi:hypothetical protein